MLLTLKSNAPGANELTLVNGATETNKRLLESANFGDAVWEHHMAGARGTQGARPAQGIPRNRPLVLPFHVHGSSKDNLASRLSELYEAMDEVRRFGGRVKWKSNNQSYAQYFELLATDGATIEEWGMGAELSGNVATMILSAQCAPYLLGDNMTVVDDFSSNTIADYTFDAGGGTLSVSGGQLVPSSTAEKALYHSARGYAYSDAQVTLKFTPGAVTTGGGAAVVSRGLDASNRINGQVGIDGASSFVAIYKLDGGVETQLGSSSSTFALVANTAYWVRLRTEGNVLTVEAFTSEPTPMMAPTVSTTHTLSGADATKFGMGVMGKAGIRTSGVDTGFRYDDFTVEPFTYRNLTLPEYIRLNGSIPGDAPALADVTVTPSGGSAAPVFALLGWSERPLTHNLVWNGDFEETGTDGWDASAPMVFNSAPTSFARVTTQKKFGAASGEVVSPATADNGPEFTVYRRFKKGVEYEAAAWVRSSAATDSCRLAFGFDGTDVANNGNVVTLSGTWQLMTVRWTPSADRDSAVVAPRHVTAAGATWQIDGVQVYKGTTAPTLGRHAEGAGAVPPFGIIEAEACDTGDLTGWTIASDAGSRGGNRLIDTSATDGETYLATYTVDPNILVPDDYTQGDLHIEVWAVAILSSTLVSPKLTLSARSSRGANFGTERFSLEYGSNGKLLTAPSSGTVRRFVRLGTVGLIVDRARPQTWKIAVAGDVAAGSSGNFGMDYLVMVPARQRALSPTGEANDASYPDFVASTSETVKVIRSDLSGAILTTSTTGTTHPDHGLGGSLLELPPGDVDVLVKLSSLAPDDPTADATTEQLAHSASVSWSVTPRWHRLRT